jgi:ankyrin repeat protein
MMYFSKCDPWTPLLWASNNGHVSIVDILLKHGANYNFQSNDVSGH